MDDSRKTNFVLQQGLQQPSAESCSMTYRALQFQPRLVGIVALVATLAQSRITFASLAAVLWWNAFVPRWNLFDLVYNRFFSRRSGLRLQPAPAPRRFAQFLAGLLAIGIAILLTFEFRIAAIVVEIVLLGAIAALVFGSFCLGSYLFHVLTGRKTFANRTLPWSAPPDSA